MGEEIPVEENRFPKWALIAGVVVVFLCLAVLLTLFLARTKLLSVAVNVLASETPTPSETMPPTNTLPPLPTETATIEINTDRDALANCASDAAGRNYGINAGLVGS